MATNYSVKCIGASPSGDGKVVTLTVEQRKVATDAEPLRTFTLVMDPPAAGATQAQINAAAVAAAQSNVAAWQREQDALAAKAAADAAIVGKYAALVGQAATVTV